MGDWTLSGGERTQDIGGTVTAHASANTKGNYTELVAATTFPIQRLVVLIGLAHELRAALVDIAVGAAGSEQVIIANLRAAYRFDQCPLYDIPVHIPAGSRIAARCQASTGSSTMTVALQAYGSGWGQIEALPRITTYGADTATSKGTAIDPGATPSTESAWVQFSASCQDTRLLLASVAPNTIQDYGGSGWFCHLDIGIGAAASEQVITTNIFLSFNTITDIYQPQVFPIYCRIPAGIRIAARSLCSIGTSPNRILNVILYGIGG